METIIAFLVPTVLGAFMAFLTSKYDGVTNDKIEQINNHRAYMTLMKNYEDDVMYYKSVIEEYKNKPAMILPGESYVNYSLDGTYVRWYHMPDTDVALEAKSVLDLEHAKDHYLHYDPSARSATTEGSGFNTYDPDAKSGIKDSR